MRRFWLFVLMLSFLTTAYAVRVESIYKASVPVSSQAEQYRDAGLQQGLGQVFIKVSGNPDVLSNPALKAQLKNASTLMQEFGYTSKNNQSQLVVRFDTEGVNKILRNAGVPIWGINRPLILAWVDYEAPNHPAEIIGNETENDIATFLSTQADSRGLPLILPTMDMTDITQVSTNDVASLSAPSLLAASKRYNSDAILAARLLQAATGFSLQAKLTLDNDHWDWTLAGKTKEEVLSQLINNIVNTLATRYASLESNVAQSHLLVKITGITQQSDLADITQYIAHIAAVVDVQPVTISGTEVLLSVNLRGARQAFVEAVALDKKLTLISNDKTMVYQWNH